jgi:hypothetical protein
MKSNLELTEAATEIFNDLANWPGLTKSTCHIFKSRDGQLVTLGVYGDIYVGLENIANETDEETLHDFEFLGVETSGWAAPIREEGDDEIAPSQHPERRRVRMLSVIDRTCRIASVMSLDDDGEILTDLAGRGSLADAIRLVMANILAAESIAAAEVTK